MPSVGPNPVGPLGVILHATDHASKGGPSDVGVVLVVMDEREDDALLERGELW